MNATLFWYQKQTSSNIYLKGNCTPNQKLAYFVLYLKIINTF